MWAIYCILFSLGIVQGTLRLDPLVDTKLGLIRGLQANDGEYSMFLGVPYAKVNEDNPFGDALPYPNFEEAFEAYDDSAVCPQEDFMSKQVTGTLDCLHLNIYVPNKASTGNKLPVMVWIHGGRFSFGSGNKAEFGPKYLVRHDVILVTINYRLGVYGFMCLDTPEVPGNQGLKDQYLAIKWVKDNIGAFGGDDGKITIMGESAGSMSIDYHLLSKRKKLFKHAIMESGSALSPKEFVSSDNRAPINISKHLGFDTDDISEALAFLAKTDPKLIIGCTEELNMYFRACAEKDFENVEKFVFEHPATTIPDVKGMTILMGFNSQEQMFTYLNEPSEFYDNLKSLLYDQGDEFEDIDDIVRHYYIGDDKISISNKWSLIAFASDYKFNHPMQRSAIRYNKNGAKAVYQYVFSYNGGRNFVKKMHNITEGGASHADELGYLFDASILHEEPSAEDQLIIDRMTTMWTNFAKSGDPTPETTELLPEKWIPISDEINFLNINLKWKMSKRPYHARMAFWDLFMKTYPEKFLPKEYVSDDRYFCIRTTSVADKN